MVKYKLLEIDGKSVKIDGKIFSAIYGKHEIYLPEKEEKIIFSIRGKTIPYKECVKKNEMINNGSLFNGNNWNEVYIQNIENEYSLLKFFESKNYSPKIGDMIFFEKCISIMGDYIIIDDVGVYGYKMKNVNNIQKGEASLEGIKNLLKDGVISCHEWAMNDLTNKMRLNFINGYIIDVRRSFRDDIPFHNQIQYNGEKVKLENL